MDCLFCKIARGDIPAKIIYEDDRVIAFEDIHPQAKHHVLIVPLNHINTLNDLTQTDNELVGHMVLTASLLAKQFNVADDGYRIVMNCNTHGGQSVYHIHAHLLGGRSFSWPPG